MVEIWLLHHQQLKKGNKEYKAKYFLLMNICPVILDKELQEGDFACLIGQNSHMPTPWLKLG